MRYASVCDGIGAAHVAWKPLGWECAWTSEIEPFPSAVVDHHFGLPNLGDMTKITEEMLNARGTVELLVGGTPCQSFSVAGLRGGLADPRGNLALRFVQLASVLKPEWIVWENVPGVLSSGKGRDFGTFLGALEQLGYGWAYRTLDAQWFGVAQRRRRVFVVCHARDWRRAAAVLFERESVFGNPPTRGEAGQKAAGAVVARSARNGGASNQDLDAGHLILSNDPAHAICRNEQRTYTNEGCVFQLRNVVAQPAPDPVAFQSNLGSHGGDVFEDGTSPTVRVGSSLGIPFPPAVAFKPSHYTRGKDGAPSEVAAPPSADADKGDQDTVVAQGIGVLAAPMAVRRLTPRECERLQGFPDDYTLIPYRNKPVVDSPRYKALGNSMAVPVMRWIGERINLVVALDTPLKQGDSRYHSTSFKGESREELSGAMEGNRTKAR